MFWRIDFYGAMTEGGVASMHKGMINAMLALGHEVIYASSGRVDLPPEVKYYFIDSSKLFRNLPEVNCLPYNSRSIKVVKKIIEKEKPDFIFQHHHDFNYGGAIIKRDTGIPFLLHCDGVQIWVKQHWGNLYLTKLLKWAEEIQWKMSDRIFVVSEAVKKMLVTYGVDGNKVVINPNGCNPSMFTPGIDGSQTRKDLGINDKYVIGFTGSFGKWHGLDTLASSIKYIISDIPNAYFLFVGDGTFRAVIEDILKKDNVEKYAKITGLVPHLKVPKFLAASDVLVSPTVNNEDKSEFFGSPTKMFEYMAMGKPIVASNVGQLGQIIRDGENGLLIPERDPEALAQRIIQLYHEPELAKRIGIGAREDAVNIYDWKHNAQRIINEYYKVIKNSEF